MAKLRSCLRDERPRVNHARPDEATVDRSERGGTNRIGRREVVFATRWFELVAKHVEGEDEPYYALRSPDCVIVLALTEDGRVPLVRQYRPALERETVELPSGHVEPGESPADAARRELLEETGYAARRLELLGSLALDTGRVDCTLWCFFAAGLSAQRRPPGAEAVEAASCPSDQLVQELLEQRLCGSFHYPVVFLAQARGLLPAQRPGLAASGPWRD
jgi:ADP-ribose pyrophosphatase